MMGQDQDCRVDVPEVPSERVRQFLCPAVGEWGCIARVTPL